MLKLTLVSLSYNHGAFVKQAIESFINQKTNFDYEVIIANDCSTDGTADIIEEYAKQYPNIIKPILRKANIGIIENYLDAMSSAKSQYVAYCECDDYFTDPYKLQKQIDFLEAHSECSICFHKAEVIYEDDSGKKDCGIPTSQDRFGKSILTIDDLLKDNFIPSNSVMYRWRFNEENIYDNFPRDIMPADYYMHLLHAQKGNIGFIDESMSVYRKHKNGTWYDENIVFEKHVFSYLRFLENVWIKFADKSYDFCKYSCIDTTLNSTFANIENRKNILSLVPNSTISLQFFVFILYRHEIIKKKLRLKKRLLMVLCIVEAIIILLFY
jgi:glycosyltransferase involved in cell wall biosynthesis